MILCPIQPVKRCPSPFLRSLSDSFGLKSWSAILPQTIYYLGASMLFNPLQSPPSHFEGDLFCFHDLIQMNGTQKPSIESIIYQLRAFYLTTIPQLSYQ
jgi:hypothetical protein